MVVSNNFPAARCGPRCNTPALQPIVCCFRDVMKSNQPGGRVSAFTLLELLVVILVVVIFIGLIDVPNNGSKARAVRINCASNLKQVGVAFRNWAGENGGRYPMQIYTNELGGPQFADAANSFRYFQIMSNELVKPKF